MIKRTGRNMKTKNVSHDTIQKIRVDQISPNPNQARIDFDKAGLVELAESIKATGLLQPIIVKPVGNRFQLIAKDYIMNSLIWPVIVGVAVFAIPQYFLKLILEPVICFRKVLSDISHTLLFNQSIILSGTARDENLMRKFMIILHCFVHLYI